MYESGTIANLHTNLVDVLPTKINQNGAVPQVNVSVELGIL